MEAVRASVRRSPDKRFQTKAGYIRGVRRAAGNAA